METDTITTTPLDIVMLAAKLSTETGEFRSAAEAADKVCAVKDKLATELNQIRAEREDRSANRRALGIGMHAPDRDLDERAQLVRSCHEAASYWLTRQLRHAYELSRHAGYSG
jgi:hypothetical protein